MFMFYFWIQETLPCERSTVTVCISRPLKKAKERENGHQRNHDLYTLLRIANAIWMLEPSPGDGFAYFG